MNDDLDKLDGDTGDSLDDLEAQLSSLGIWGDDDGDAADPFAGFNFDDEDAADPFASLNFDDDAGAASSDPAPAQIDGDMDLDKQLEMLLMADQTADEGFEMKDMSSSMPTHSVYDPEVDGMGSVQYVKGAFVKDSERKQKLFANISPFAMAATFIIGVFLIVVGGATALAASFIVQAQNEQIAALDMFTPIEIPADTANNARNIFINRRAFVDETPFTITRLVAAHTGTFFYFDEHFNPDDFYILLYDQARNLYARASFNITAAADGGTVLSFMPLSRNTLFLTLHIQCRSSHEYAQFKYRFTAPPIHETPAFINLPVQAMGEGGITVRHAVFDSGSSVIHYSYTPVLGEGLRLNMQGEPFVQLFERFSATAIFPLTNENAYVGFDDFDLLMGAAVFGPVMNLESDVEVHFSGLSYFVPEPVVKIAPSQLFGNYQWDPISARVGDFTLNFEGMIQRGNRIYLTLHGLNENGRRVPTHTEIYLNVRTDGDPISMRGFTNVYTRGTDVIFDMRPYGARLRDVHISEYYFVVNSVEFELPSVVVPLTVTQFNNMPRQRRLEAELAVIEAFNSLLAYKSGEISRDSFVGLSHEVRTSAALLELFARGDFDERPMYAVRVVAGDLEGAYHFLGVAEVTWVAGEGADLQYFREVFRVAAESTDLIWSITDVRLL